MADKPDYTRLMNDLLALSHVPRWTIVRHTRPQSVADHSFRVAVIAFELARRRGELFNTDGATGLRPGNLLWLALTHDVDESVSGDIPSPVRKTNLKIGEGFGGVEWPSSPQSAYELGFTKREYDIMKEADIIEAYTYMMMNGTGSHAHEVTEHLKSKLNHVALALVDEIVNELGRLRK